MVLLRYCTDEDAPLIMAWNSQPAVQGGFYTLSKNPHPLTWEEHSQWWADTSHWTKLIIEYEGRPVGLIRISHLENWCPEIAISIGEVSLWGNEIGTEALRLVLRWLRFIGKEYVNTVVMKHNLRAISLFRRLDFEERGDAREGEIWFQKRLRY